MTADRYKHARQNAKAWAEELIAAHKAYQEAQEDDHDTTDTITERCLDMPLSVLVRFPWMEPGRPRDDAKPEEYEILLSTGGPALRIRGELDQWAEPSTARLEMQQDWGVPWTEADWGTPCGDFDYNELADALKWFAGLFWYGG